LECKSFWRVEALVRRNRAPVAPAYLGLWRLQIDLVQRRVCFQGEFIDLTPQNLVCSTSWLKLVEYPEPVGVAAPLGQTLLTTHALSIPTFCRCVKVEIDPRQPSLIQTIRNVGYRLNTEILNTSIAKPSEFAHHQRSAAQFKTIQLSTSDELTARRSSKLAHPPSSRWRRIHE